jgi:hypothetical protein
MASCIKSFEKGTFASRIWLDGFQWKRRCNWIGRMNNLAFGISSMQEAIITNRWRKSLAVDWFVVNQNKQMLMEDREKTLNLLINLGCIVNLEKSNLIPTQTITYIGAMFCLKNIGCWHKTLRTCCEFCELEHENMRLSDREKGPNLPFGLNKMV